MAWLVSHGIDATKLRAKGFGFDVPISDNKTDEGRRRAEAGDLEDPRPAASERRLAPDRVSVARPA